MTDPPKPQPQPEENQRPDLPCADQAASVGGQAQARPYRLGCIHCDRTDFDGVEQLPTDWARIAWVQHWQDSLSPVDVDDPVERGLFGWQTHLGICPRCNPNRDEKR